MKIIVKKEFDGRSYVAYCENVPGVYVQAPSKEVLDQRLKKALSLLKHFCQERNQPFPTGADKPIFDVRIKFNRLSSDKLIELFRKKNYHIEYNDSESIMLMNSDFPFNHVHLPVTDYLSPIIIRKLFGLNNAIYVGKNNLKLRKTAP
ncbi:type II toxin-antitoxin system HicB family antitoxin [Calditrichota bacterium LG25]